tara:strand:- start:45 stop:611 length:567 start_codon:yes stop_codon:yes gene_type:complete
MRIVKVDSEIIKELRSSGISKVMRSLETADWLVLADMNGKIVGAAGIGGLFNVSLVQTRKDYQGKGVGGLLQVSVIEEAKKRGYSYITGLIDINNKLSLKLNHGLGFKTIFRIHYEKNITQDIIILVLKPQGKIVEAFLRIFNTKVGTSVLACFLKISKFMFPKIINYNENKIPNPGVKYIIKNFEKV